MTLKELSQVYYLRKEIDRLEAKINALSSGPGGSQITGMPGRGSKVSDPVADTIERKSKYEDLLRSAHKRYSAELDKLEQYIQSIEDSRTRQVFELRFEQLMSWQKVAEHLRTSEYSVKHTCYRYLKHR